ncbi:MAG: hypothetical protein AAF501_17765, partial [Pseudomonadota bacterium]
GALDKLEDSSRDYLKVCAQRKAQLGDPPDPKELAIIEEREKVAIEALKRTRLTKVANEFETLGPPPWDSATAEKAAELQAAFFFQEAAVKHGTANYEAPALDAGEGGASGSWWIERSEGSAKDDKSEKKYIFKPSSREATAFRGLPPGSGAPREVLAKKLDELMVGLGFEVGVCPTSLVDIDSSSLGGDMDPDLGPQLGSMQKLTASDGPAGPMLTEDPELIKAIGKKNFDDIAVFDMVFCNFDRHGKNVLIEKDEETGVAKLLPIDHGSALADPDTIRANRRALLPPDNFMADPGLPQGNMPLGPESRDALKRMDPDAMLRQMKQERTDLEGRHDGAKGMVKDPELNAMANRVRFMQAVCDDMPVSEMFECLAYAGKRIAECKPDDLADLVKDIRAESTARREGLEEYKEFAKALDGSISSISRSLQDLGWATSINLDNMEAWINDNAALVARVLKSRIVNPEGEREKQRMIALIKPHRPEIEREIENRPLSDQLDTLHQFGKSYEYPVPDSDDALEREYLRLGGDDQIKELLEEWPNEDDARARRKNQVGALLRYQDLQALGGVKRFVELGGALARAEQMINVIRQIKDREGSQTARDKVEKMKPEEVEASRKAAWDSSLKAINDIIAKLRNPVTRKTTEDLRDPAIKLWNEPKHLEAQAALEVARLDAVASHARETAALHNNEKFRNRFLDRLRKTPDSIQSGFKKTLDDLNDRLDLAADVLDTNRMSALLRELSCKLDIAEQGDEAPIQKITALWNSKQAALGSHAGKVWAQQLDEEANGAKDALAKYDTATLESKIMQIDKILKVCDPLVSLEATIKGL